MASMCLTSDGNHDMAKIFYSSCSEKNRNQIFIFKRLKSNLFTSFGRLYSGMADSDWCMEMHSTNNDQLFMHSNCWDTYEIMKNGALKNIKEGKCLGSDESDRTQVNAVDCDSEHVEIWNPKISILTKQQDWNSLKTLGQCADLENQESVSDAIKAKLSKCNPFLFSQHWHHDDFGRLINRNTVQCLEGKLNGNIFILDCNNQKSQQWSKNENKFLNTAFQKYLGVISCGSTTSDSKFLELQNLNNTSGTCNDTQTWDMIAQTACGNDHESCDLWAKEGECDNNPAYMKSSCKKACGLCHQVSLFLTSSKL